VGFKAPWAKSAVWKKDFSTRREALNMITAEPGITQPGKTSAPHHRRIARDA
jgi:hypothetical protein